MKLYHGSNQVIRMPEIRPMVRALDFGQAFYLTSSREQAVKWAKTSALRRGEGVPVVSVFDFDDSSSLTRIRTLKFDEPSVEWLRFVSSNRVQNIDAGEYDLVIGPVANDNTMPVLNLYFKGAYTEDEALRRLLPQRLNDQFAFKTERALGCLAFVEAVEVV